MSNNYKQNTIKNNDYNDVVDMDDRLSPILRNTKHLIPQVATLMHF